MAIKRFIYSRLKSININMRCIEILDLAEKQALYSD